MNIRTTLLLFGICLAALVSGLIGAAIYPRVAETVSYTFQDVRDWLLGLVLIGQGCNCSTLWVVLGIIALTMRSRNGKAEVE